ncbi:hypothetical protein PCE1_004503 [Barthelona sp. PCE]
MSSDDRYSRLTALAKMGIVPNYEEIREKTVLLVGVGGIGSTAAEMLTRCGVGKLIMYDYDTVELSNMNRLFFRPNQAGMSKVDAAHETLREINDDVVFVTRHHNISVGEGYIQMTEDIARGGLQNQQIDLLLCCVDNYQARIAINRACIALNQVWYESGVSESAVSGHISLVLPGVLPCFECAPPLMVVEGTEAKREGVCAASLSTTMGIVAGLLVQNSLKLLLTFGSVSRYLGYNALLDFFPMIDMERNPGCNACSSCVSEHKSWDDWVAANHNPLAEQKAAEEKERTKIQQDKMAEEFGIEIMEDDVGGSLAVENKTDGVQYSFVAPNEDDIEKVHIDASLDELDAELAGLQL